MLSKQETRIQMLCAEAAGLKIDYEKASMKRDPFISMAVLITIVTVVLSIIDASMTVNHRITSEKIQHEGFLDWVTKIPWWWNIVIIVLTLFIVVGVLAFSFGREGKLFSRDYKRLILVILIPVILMISGVFDLISATVIEYLRSNQPLSWMNYGEWWWIAYHPFPRISAAIVGRTYPIGTDLMVGSIGGVIILVIIFHYLKSLSKSKKEKG